jgi:two-component system response regulator (stage 0 sporulation protein F)
MVGYDLLIVDDQAGVRRLLYEVFLVEGYLVDMASSGAEAVQKVCERKPQVVLLDHRMPVMSGLETARKIREVNQEVPIIMMTAYNETGVFTEAKKTGVNYCFNKPFDVAEIRCLVKALVEEKRFSEGYLEEIV